MNTDDQEWTLEWYTTENGKSPVKEFLLELDKDTRAELNKQFENLRQLNIQAKAPFVKPIDGKLWELRKKINRNAYRVFYVCFTGKKIVLLHAFIKKTQKTPPKEIDLALQRFARYKAINGGNN